MRDIVTELRAGPVNWQIMSKAADEIELLREEKDAMLRGLQWANKEIVRLQTELASMNSETK